VVRAADPHGHILGFLDLIYLHDINIYWKPEIRIFPVSFLAIQGSEFCSLPTQTLAFIHKRSKIGVLLPNKTSKFGSGATSVIQHYLRPYAIVPGDNITLLRIQTANPYAAKSAVKVDEQ
jgi:hypothetical protein